jgi:hypothetical protein
MTDFWIGWSYTWRSLERNSGVGSRDWLWGTELRKVIGIDWLMYI